MGCLDATATRRSIRTMLYRQQFLKRPGSWAELAAPPPVENARRAHIKKAGGLSLARHQEA